VKRSPKFGRKLLIPLLLLMAIVPVGLAEVVYLFQGSITVSTTPQPLQFVYGNDASSGAASSTAGTYAKVSLIGGNSVNNYAYGFSATVNITNSSYDLLYQIIGLDVLAKSAYIYVTNVSYKGSIVDNAWIIIQENTNSQVIQIIKNDSTLPGTWNTTVTLTQGTYQVSLLIQPVSGPGLTSSSTASITVYFGDNVISSTGVPLPPGV